MGRKSGSYKFEKRQKELKKQKKKREKLERRQNKGAEMGDEPQPTGWIGGSLDRGDTPESDDAPDSQADPDATDET